MPHNFLERQAYDIEPPFLSVHPHRFSCIESNSKIRIRRVSEYKLTFTYLGEPVQKLFAFSTVEKSRHLNAKDGNKAR